MSRKRKRKQSATDGLCRALAVCLVLCAVIGAAWYLCRTRPEVRDALPPAVRSAVEQAEESVAAITERTEKALGALSPQETAPAVSAPRTPEKPAPSAAASPRLVVLPDALEMPLCAAARHESDHEIRTFSGYALCYRESYELAEWSAYCLERAELAKNAARSNDFRADPAISTGSATLADYRGSGYDRGHLAPAADFAYSQEAMSETFYMSNMTPQAPSFNRGIWQQLEAQVRLWAAEYGRAYVATGPVLDAPAADYAAIGENAVRVPRAFYKVVLVPLYADEADEATPGDCADVAAFAFIIPNEKCAGSFYDYACSVDEAEERTGLDFFSLLDDAIETRVEAEKRTE